MSLELVRGFQLGPCTVEPSRGVVTGPGGKERHLEPKVMDVLLCLARQANEVVSREALHEEVWSGRPVGDESLTRAIWELRRVLADVAGDVKYIETIPKRGYRLLGIVTYSDQDRPGQPSHDRGLPAIQPDSRLRRNLIALLAVTLPVSAMLYLAYDRFVVAPMRQDVAPFSTSPIAMPARIESPEVSIVVLPFVSLSDDPADDFFAQGLSEEIRTLLQSVPGIDVIGSTSALTIKTEPHDFGAIGRTLGVNYVLEGSVRKSGDRIRILPHLVNASSGVTVWSRPYNRPVDELFAMQDDVASAIVDAMQVHVGTRPVRGRPTENLAAYALFLKARLAFNTFDLIEADGYLSQAVDLDPAFAEAYELRAAAFARMAGDTMNAADGQRLVLEYAEKALSIDPSLAFAQAYLQLAGGAGYSATGAIASFERVLLEQPSNTEALDVLSWELFVGGILDEAMEYAERSVELDPLSNSSHYRKADVLYAVGHVDEAIETLEFADRIGGQYAKWALGEINLAQRRDELAIRYFEEFLEEAGAPPYWVRELVTAVRVPAIGQAYLDRRIPEIVATLPERLGYQMRLNLQRWYLLFGFLDGYFEIILESDLVEPTWTDAEVLIHGGVKFRRLGFTRHPRYLELARDWGLVDLWEQRGAPDFCTNTDGEWVCL